MLLANIIFPAPSAVYVSTFFVPVATLLALAVEFWIVNRMQRGVTTPGRLLGIVLLINLASWVAGMGLSLLLPSGLVPQLTASGVAIIQPGPQWNRIALLSFPAACVVSAVLEGLALRGLCRWVPFRAPWRTALLANLASYAVLAVTVYAALRFKLVR